MSLLMALLMATTTISSTASLSAAAVPMKVVVTGAGGQTGQALFRKLLALPDEFAPIGIVRSRQSKQRLVESAIPPDSVVVVDVTAPDAAKVLRDVAAGCGAFCIATSAKPAPSGETTPEGRPIFAFPNGDPELVDWIGQKNQIDACPAGAHVVLCSSMGGSDPNHSLNSLGRRDSVADAPVAAMDPSDGTTTATATKTSSTGGNILKWKRKAEVYLTQQSHLAYTIVHPGGLVNEPGGMRELVLSVDDRMDGTESRSIPREDVVELMLQALRHRHKYANRSLDVRAKPVGDGTPTTDFAALVDTWLGADRNCDYSLGETM
jgi:uncharacterized protein YbjT (DUF2867 family)